MSIAAEVAPLAAPQRTARRKPTLLDAIRWETSKLAAQARARVTLLVCLLAPVLIVVVINGQQRPPKDSLFGRYIHASGFAVPLLVLGFAAQWVLPLLTALVAGDIFASEDQHGTWKTVLTRSASRAQLFWAKTITALAFAVGVLVIVAASTIVSSVIIVGHQDLIGLTGQVIPSGTAARLVIASWAPRWLRCLASPAWRSCCPSAPATRPSALPPPWSSAWSCSSSAASAASRPSAPCCSPPHSSHGTACSPRTPSTRR
jgi:ABC-2 type transport system permease protein